MKMKNKTTLIKAMIVLVLTIVMTAGLCGPDGSVYAGGSVKISLGTIQNLPPDTEFTYNIYKVGSWTHVDGKAVVQLDQEIADKAGIASPSLPSPESKTYNADLVALATTVGNSVAIDGLTTAAKPVTLKQGDTKYFNGLSDNGLYIIVGEPKIVGRKVWTPSSVFVSVLNGESEMNISNEVATKMSVAPVVDEYKIVKIWNDEENAKKTRPDKVDVEIYYNNELKDTVTLTQNNNWSYSWKTYEDNSNHVIYENNDADKDHVISKLLPKKGEDGEPVTDDKGNKTWSADVGEYAENGVWTVREVNDRSLRKYTFTLEGPSEQKPGTFTLTNTYSTTDLEITKKLDGFFDTGDNSNVTVAFKITGKDAKGTVVYTNYAGLSFTRNDVDENGKFTKKTTVTGIPLSAVTIDVEEVYASGYTGKKVAGPEKGTDDIWTVTFENTHGDHSGSGVVNKYEDGKIKEQQR